MTAKTTKKTVAKMTTNPVLDNLNKETYTVSTDQWSNLAATAQPADADTFAPVKPEVPKPFYDLINASLEKGGLTLNVVAPDLTGDAEKDAETQKKFTAAFLRLLRAAAADSKTADDEPVSVLIKEDGTKISFKAGKRRGRKTTSATPAESPTA